MARELLIELKQVVHEAVTARGCAVSDVLGQDRSAVRELIRLMPGTEVSTSLEVEDRRNSSKRWECNNIFAVDALSQAVPYCDVVVTDGHRNHILRTARLDERMNTVVLADLSRLPAQF